MSALPKETSAELSARFGVPARSIRDIAQQYKIAGGKGVGYDPMEIAAGLVEYYRTRLESFDADAAKDRARKARAEADNVELDNAEKRGDIKRRLLDVVGNFGVEVRKTVSGAAWIPIDGRKRLCRELAEIKVDVPVGK